MARARIGDIESPLNERGVEAVRSALDELFEVAPTDDLLAAFAGTSGTPAKANEFVTDDDSRMTNSRAPTAHALVGALHSASGLTTNHVLLATGGTTFAFSALPAAALPSHNHAASEITSGLLALARGGTNADLSGTGGASRVLKQLSAGAAITVAALTSGELPAHTHAEGDITDGTILARVGSIETIGAVWTFSSAPVMSNSLQINLSSTGGGQSPTLGTNEPVTGTPAEWLTIYNSSGQTRKFPVWA